MGLRYLMGDRPPRTRAPSRELRERGRARHLQARGVLLHVVRHPEVAYRVATHAALAELREGLGGRAAGARPRHEVVGAQPVGGDAADELAHAPLCGGHRLREGFRVQRAAVGVAVEGEGGAGGSGPRRPRAAHVATPPAPRSRPRPRACCPGAPRCRTCGTSSCSCPGSPARPGRRRAMPRACRT